MTSLVEQLDALSINDEEERKNLFAYIYQTKQSKMFFLCGNDFVVIPDCDKKQMLLCKLIRNMTKNNCHSPTTTTTPTTKQPLNCSWVETN